MTAREAPGADEIVDAYLDDLPVRLVGHPREVRRMLSEAEAHLRDEAEAASAAGLDPEEAGRRAVAAFGPPAAVARRCNQLVGWVPPRTLVRQLTLAVLLGTGVGLVAIGVSGLDSDGLGPAFVAGDPPGVTYTAARCADFSRLVSTARTWQQAAAVHHWGEVVEYRGAVGVLGLVVLAGWACLRRR